MSRTELKNLLDTFLGHSSVHTLTRDIRLAMATARPSSARREAVKVAGRETLDMFRALSNKR